MKIIRDVIEVLLLLVLIVASWPFAMLGCFLLWLEGDRR